MTARTFIVGYDGSPVAERALARAAELARALGASLVVASAAPMPVIGGVDVTGLGGVDVPYPPPEVQDEAVHGMWEVQQASVNAVLEREGVPGEFVSAMGDASSALIALAEERHAELIVVGTREAGFFERVFTGSVSGDVGRRAPCDVLIVHHHH